MTEKVATDDQLSVLSISPDILTAEILDAPREEGSAKLADPSTVVDRESLLNRRIHVLWDDGLWYTGTVTRIVGRRHRVVFSRSKKRLEYADLRLIGYKPPPKGNGNVWKLEMNEDEAENFPIEAEKVQNVSKM